MYTNRTMIEKTLILAMLVMFCSSIRTFADPTYVVVDTGQIRCYNNNTEIQYPKTGAAFFGQDAHYNGNQPAYKDNGDGTITDLNTGLMWQRNPGSKKTFSQAVADSQKCKIAGLTDWRLPSIKELYSLIIFSGTDPDARSTDISGLQPFIDTRYFGFKYGNPNPPQRSERIIDSQFATSTKYVHKTMRGNETMFGVNFADGRIKGYPMKDPRGRGGKKFYVMYVRGNKDYGKNQFVDNQDGTITDKATGLTWTKNDSRKGMPWKEALGYAEKLELAGKTDWRLPNAKELQSIVDYSRSPATANSAAIDPIFTVSKIKANETKGDFPFYWTSTTHKRDSQGQAAVYISFGTGFGWMTDRRTGQYQLLDVHGAGCQRSDPKAGNPSDFPHGRGPQGDVIRIYNYVRCVRGGTAKLRTTGPKIEMKRTSRRFRRNRQQPQLQNRRTGRAPSGDDFVRRLDRDGDGKVSRQEFDGPGEHFQRLDKNRDGYLSSDEAPQGPPPNRNHRPPSHKRTNRQRR